MKKNKFIVFEGIDGVGKTTISRELTKTLKKEGIRVARFKMFDQKPQGYNRFKPFVKQYSPVNASLFFYIASLLHRYNKVEKLMKKHWVVCDRCLYTTIAQHLHMGADTKGVDIKRLPVLKPDFYFLLKVREDIRLKRIRKRGLKTKYDKRRKKKGGELDYIERTLNSFRPFVINNNGTIQATLDNILKIIHSK